MNNTIETLFMLCFGAIVAVYLIACVVNVINNILIVGGIA